MSLLHCLAREKRSAVAVEISIVALPFFMLILGTMEVSYDLFVQAALNAAVSKTARQIQSGSVQMLDTSAGGTSFVSTYMCPNTGGLLQCGNIYVNIQKVTTGDFYLNAAPAYLAGSGPSATLATSSWSACTGGQGATILFQAVYAGPTFVGGLLHAFVATSSSGYYFHPTYASEAFINAPQFTQTVSC